MPIITSIHQERVHPSPAALASNHTLGAELDGSSNICLDAEGGQELWDPFLFSVLRKEASGKPLLTLAQAQAACGASDLKLPT